ncbi:tudor domain-containing protein 1 [Procambarus clarkii]|uniref:tudor domain-containing protein 1 n=1 Tax=Procambarus clarkii TaxID=6728 RepID=UPI003743AF13
MEKCEKEQKQYHLQHLLHRVELAISKTKLQLDEQITMVSDAALNVKYLPQHQFLKVVPKLKYYLQKSLDLQKSIQQMLQEYMNYTKLDHWDLESICMFDKCPLGTCPRCDNKNLTGELNVTPQCSDENIKRDAKVISQRLIPYNRESSDVQCLNKDAAVQTSWARLEDLTYLESISRIPPVIDIKNLDKEETSSSKSHSESSYKECEAQDHISKAQDAVMDATYQVWGTKLIVDSVDSGSSSYQLDTPAHHDTSQTVNSAANSIPLNQPVKVCVCTYEPSKKLWIHFLNSGLEELEDELNQAVLKQTDDCWQQIYPGQRVAAPYLDDGFYYRAQVLKHFAKENKMNVHFIDYGNSRKVYIKNLRLLPPRLAEIPEMAICCSIMQIDDELLSDDKGYEHHNWFKKINYHLISDLPMTAIFEKNEHGRDVKDFLNYSLHSPRYKIRLFSQDYNVSEIKLNADMSSRDDNLANSRNCSEVSIGDESYNYNHEETTNIVPSVDTAICSTPERHSLYAISLINPQENIDIEKKSLKKQDLDENYNHIISECDSDSSSVVPLSALPRVTLPLLQPSMDGQPRPVMLVHVNTPNHFYLHLVNSETASLDRFCETMNDKYKDDDEILHVIELPVKSCWAARWSDGMWYRARILANIISSPEKNSHKKCPKVKVLFIDYGDEEILSIKDIRFLHEDFTLLPSLAIPCCLAQVFPPAQKMIGSGWPSDSIKKFLDLCGGTWSVLFANFQQYHMSGTYSIILRDSEGVVVNEELVAQGFAVSNSTPQESDHSEDRQKHKGLEDIGDAEEKLPEGWDPMSSAYLDHKNTVHHSDECAETVLYGMKNTDETRLCKYFRNGRRCPRREACRWEHSRARKGVTVEKEIVLQECLEPHPLALENAILAVVVTSIISPSKFHVYLPFGSNCLQQQTDFEDETARTLELLLTAMEKYYTASRQVNKCLPAPGELKALCELKDGKLECSRVQILDVKEEECVSQVQVFFIDFGYMEWVSDDQLRPLAAQFTHTPPQALQCGLTGVKPPLEGWHPSAVKYLRELTEGFTLVAHVNYVDRDHQHLGVTLYNTNDGKDININECFLRKLENKL